MGRYLSRRVPGVTFDVVDVGVESELRPLAGRGQPRIDRDGSGFAVHRANLIHALYELASHASEPRGALAYLDQVLLIAPEWSLARRLYDDTKRLIA
jgi:hypothetical protein